MAITEKVIPTEKVKLKPILKVEVEKETEKVEPRTPTWAEIQNQQRGLTLDGKPRVK